jgi:TolB-like protein
MDSDAEAPAPAAPARRTSDVVIITGLVAAVALLFADRFLISRDVVEPQASTAPATDSTTSAPTDRSLVVLPFANLSADAENEFFADGLSEELMNVLTQAPGLRVIGRTSSFAWKGRNEDLRSIGAALGVSHLLEGSVRRQGDRVRITAQLIRASDGSHLWSQNYDRTLDDVFAIQDDIAGSVLEALEIVLDDAQRARMQQAGVRDVEAFVEYQKGYRIWDRAHGGSSIAEDLEPAHAHFTRAVARVPEFAAAHFIDADYYVHRLAAAEGYLSRAEQEADHAALIAALAAARDSSADPLRRAIADAELVLFSADWRPLRDRIERALREPGCARTLLFEQVMLMGYANPLIDMYRREVACDPHFKTAWWDMAVAALWAGELPATLAIIDEAEAVVGRDTLFEAARTHTLLALGRIEEATAAARYVAVDEDIYGMAIHGGLLAYQGRSQDALALLAAQEDERVPSAMDLRMLVYAMIGDRERANALAAEVDARPAGPVLLTMWINVCACGLPFEMDSTPNLKARIEESGIAWPPPTLIRFPLKTW